MTAPISIAELESSERAMTQGEWKHGSWQYEKTPKFAYTHIAPSNDEDASITVDSPPPNSPMDVKSVIGGCGCCGSPSGDHADIQGIVALRNAAPVLLAVVRAAIAWQEASDAMGEHLEQIENLGVHDSRRDEMLTQSSDLGKREARAEMALHAALNAVTR